MEVCDYVDIIRELRAIGGLNVNDRFFNSLSKKYNLSEERLRSIIGLWYQRKVAGSSFKVKEIDIYDLYKHLLTSGEKNACLKIAETLEYPPSLIAKIVVTNFTTEKRIDKAKKNANESKNLRERTCSGCCRSNVEVSVAENASTKIESTMVDHSSPTVKRCDDPRIELALNLFDEDDEIGKYFLNKFTFSRNTKKENDYDKKMERNKSNKFFWHASTFEEMGEKNIKKLTNVAELFSSPNAGTAAGLQSRLERGCAADRICKSNGENGAKEASVNSLDISSPATVEVEKSIPNSRISTDRLNSDRSPRTDSSTDNANTKSNELKSCNYVSDSNSENSDTDSADSEDTHDNFSVKELLENPSLIEDPVLAQDVFLCSLYDDQYGPTSDIIANSSGITYERILEEHVRSVGLSYKTENKLRGVGVDKTPDIILLVPVAVNDFVINWIESKALFADYKLHQDFENNQFKNYINRFGPGLVIYWHGYTTDIRKSELVNKQLIIEEGFPSRESFTFVNSDKFKLWMQSVFPRS